MRSHPVPRGSNVTVVLWAICTPSVHSPSGNLFDSDVDGRAKRDATERAEETGQVIVRRCDRDGGSIADGRTRPRELDCGSSVAGHIHPIAGLVDEAISLRSAGNRRVGVDSDQPCAFPGSVPDVKVIGKSPSRFDGAKYEEYEKRHD